MSLDEIRGDIPKPKADKTRLMRAVEIHDQNLVTVLLRSGEDVNARDSARWTPLHYAVTVLDDRLVNQLLDAGADSSALSAEMLTPLHIAAMKQDLKITETLVQHGAPVNYLDIFRGTPLSYAAQQKSERLARLLITSGAQLPVAAEPTLADVSARAWTEELTGEIDVERGDTTSAAAHFARAADLYQDAASKNDALVSKLESQLRVEYFKAGAVTVLQVAGVVLAVQSARMDAEMRANQMAEISALKSPTGHGVGYGVGFVPFTVVDPGAVTGGISGVKRAKDEHQRRAAQARADAESCRSRANGQAP